MDEKSLFATIYQAFVVIQKPDIQKPDYSSIGILGFIQDDLDSAVACFKGHGFLEEYTIMVDDVTTFYTN